MFCRLGLLLAFCVISGPAAAGPSAPAAGGPSAPPRASPPAPAPSGRSLLAVTSRSPWTLRDLENRHLDLVSYDPDTGVIYLTATPEELRRLLDDGFSVRTVQPDMDAARRKLLEVPDLGLYHTWEETVFELESLHDTFPKLTHFEVIGTSLEGRPIHALKISDDPEFEDPSEPDVLVVGNHHARELMSVEVPLFLARTLLSGYGRSPRITALVDSREVWIVPMLNPDGHVYQEETQLLPGWRKNRRRIGPDVLGVDLNRNYSYQWAYDNVGSSPEPVDENYRGESAFSEPESDVMRQFVERQDFTVALSYHSFGSLVLYPWGYTRAELTPDQSIFEAVADSMVRENHYRPGNPYFGTIYLTNGEFDDWMYGHVDAAKERQTFSFTVELNSEQQGGFWPSEELIEPTCDLMLELNLYAIGVAGHIETVGAPPPAELAGYQEPENPRRIHLNWTMPRSAANPADHFEVFEIDPTGTPGSWAAASAIKLEGSGTAILARDVQIPRGGRLALQVHSDLEPPWDHASVEVRRAGAGEWQPLSLCGRRYAAASEPSGWGQDGSGQRDVDPRLTGRFGPRLLDFDARSFAGSRVDIAMRLDAYPDSPRRPRLEAAVDVGRTLAETRRVLVPDLRDTTCVVAAVASGILAYGVTAVDAEGQGTDSNLLWFAVPQEVAVAVQDVNFASEGGRALLHARVVSEQPARFEAWTRALHAGETPAAPDREWARGDYALAARATVDGPGELALGWPLPPGATAVLLRGDDAGEWRVWGPWVAGGTSITRLHGAMPNPFVGGTRIRVDVGRSTPLELDIVRIDGKRVRRLVSGSIPAGARDVSWDGRDDNGRAVASGLYLARLRVGPETQVSHLLLLR